MAADKDSEIVPADHLRPLTPIIGRWQTSGVVLDEHCNETATIAGTDTYRWLVGGNWVIHDVDVMMGNNRAQVLEMIGGEPSTDGTYAMRAFDASGSFDTMTLRIHADSLVAEGVGIRSTLRRGNDGVTMSAQWEREVAPDRWALWMDMRFDRT